MGRAVVGRCRGVTGSVAALLVAASSPESESDSNKSGMSFVSGIEPPSLSESEVDCRSEGGSLLSTLLCAVGASCGMGGIDAMILPAEPGMQTLVASVTGDDGMVP